MFYTYVDRDVTIKGARTGGVSAGLALDLDMCRGWNTTILDFAALEFRSEKPNGSYRGLIPFGTIGSPPEAQKRDGDFGETEPGRFRAALVEPNEEKR